MHPAISILPVKIAAIFKNANYLKQHISEQTRIKKTNHE